MGGRKADELEGSGSSVGSGPVVVTEFYSYEQLVERKRDGKLDGIHPTALEVSRPSSCETVLTSTLTLTLGCLVGCLFVQEYVCDSEFKQVFKMSRDEFRKLPKWRQKRIKQDVGLF
jgi:hypothetical protein